MFTLSALQLRFTCEAITPLRLSGYLAGSQLRGALGNVMRRAYCAHLPSSVDAFSMGEEPGKGACPVCWLLAANEHPGEERRGYALIPPRQTSEVSEDLRGLYAPGQRFSFGLTLFGHAQRFLPYFILAVPEMGRTGVGAGRGQFVLRSVTAIDLLEGQDQVVLAEGESLVHVPDRLITPERVQTLTPALSLEGGGGGVHLNFLTPMRLIEDERLVKMPDFGVLFKRLLERLDELNQQFGGGMRRPAEGIQRLQALANQVRLIEAQTQWIELKSGSTRSGQATWLSGFVGPATYTASGEVWRELRPWLWWGSIAQVGKDVVKGNGVFEIVSN